VHRILASPPPAPPFRVRHRSRPIAPPAAAVRKG
jgi:hypothetical protein